ncbi:MAG: hypothetical protein ACR2P1_03630 [Pseudomonadales bacterium]
MTINAGSPDPTSSELIVEGDIEGFSPDAVVANDATAEPAPQEVTAPWQFDDLDPLAPIADLIHSLTDYEKQRVDPETGQVLTVEHIKVDIPFELRVSEGEGGLVTVEGSAPSQRTATSLIPVFHRMQLRIVEDGNGS